MKLPLIVLALLATGSTTALAHITLEQQAAKAGSTYKAILRVPHGCDGSPTTAITIFLPADIVGAKPMPKAGWKVKTVTEKLVQPYESHGTPVTERVARITWSGGRLLDTEYDEFVFRASLPATPGKQWMRILQVCAKGEIDWSGIPVDGEARPAQPAALLNVLPADAAPAHH